MFVHRVDLCGWGGKRKQEEENNEKKKRKPFAFSIFRRKTRKRKKTNTTHVIMGDNGGLSVLDIEGFSGGCGLIDANRSPPFLGATSGSVCDIHPVAFETSHTSRFHRRTTRMRTCAAQIVTVSEAESRRTIRWLASTTITIFYPICWAAEVFST
jgi:hypothetical protein